MHTKKQKRVIRVIGVVAIFVIIMGLILPYVGMATIK